MINETSATPMTGTASACEGCENPVGRVFPYAARDYNGAEVPLVRYCDACADEVRSGRGDFVVKLLGPSSVPLFGHPDPRRCTAGSGCPAAVVELRPGRWYITAGHRGFNTERNNGDGYDSEAEARRILRLITRIA